MGCLDYRRSEQDHLSTIHHPRRLLEALDFGEMSPTPPFLKTSELMTNLDQMKDDQNQPFTNAAQRACLLRQLSKIRSSPKIPLVLVEPNDVPKYIAKELKLERKKRPVLNIYLIGSKSHQEGSYRVFEPSELEDPDNNLELLGSDIIIIGSDAYQRIAEYLPLMLCSGWALRT